MATGWMGNICYHVSNIPQWRLVDGGDHPPVVTGVWCIDWVLFSSSGVLLDLGGYTAVDISSFARQRPLTMELAFISSTDALGFKSTPHLCLQDFLMIS